MTHTPTPAEIETLREYAKKHHVWCVSAPANPNECSCGAFQIRAILDRLSPPAPEVDEATRIWRGMNHAGDRARYKGGEGHNYLSGEWDHTTGAQEEISYLRTALSELIASKDAEIAEWKAVSGCAKEQINDLTRRAEKAESDTLRWHNAYEIAHGQAMSNGSELAAISAAIGTTEFMDPPDGGSPTLAEQVGRMRAELAALRAENERLKDTIADLGVDLDEWQRCERAAGNIPSPKAAERNTAEPALDGETSVFPPMAKATDTTPVVTQTARDIASGIMKERGLKRSNGYAYTIALQAAAEAEARGRRQALEEAIASFETKIPIRFTSIEIVDELKRLMTKPKP